MQGGLVRRRSEPLPCTRSPASRTVRSRPWRTSRAP